MAPDQQQQQNEANDTAATTSSQLPQPTGDVTGPESRDHDEQCVSEAAGLGVEV